MSKTAMIRARVEPTLKEQAETTLGRLGLTPTTAIGLFYRQIVEHQGLPFDVRIPSTVTRRAMLDARIGRGVVAAGSTEELFAKLDSAEDRTPARSKKKARARR